MLIKTKLKWLNFILIVVLIHVACQPMVKQDVAASQEQAKAQTQALPALETNAEGLRKVVVLYDDQRQSEFSDVADNPNYNEVDGARINAQIVANLVGGTKGYFGEIAPVSSYQSGDANKVARVIYLGSTFNHPIPESLERDIVEGANITWAGYNFWQLNPDATQRSLGIKYERLESAGIAEEVDKSFSRIEYQGYTFKKQLQPTDMTRVSSTAANTRIVAWARNRAGERIPYALQKDSFWFIADVPLAWVYERDRYLVFADLIPKMLGVNLTCEPRAIIRVEDVKPSDNAVDLKRTFDLLERLEIPYGIATVPVWRNEGTNQTITWQDNPEALQVVLDAQASRGQVLQHGYTHSYDGLLNPAGTSGADWEFWNINEGKPISELTPAMALQRVATGKAVLEDLGLYPIGWVTPHYAADPSYYPKFKELYFRHFERKFIGSGDTVAGQLFPYPVRDVNNRTLVLPENARFIAADNTLDDILETAKANKALSCPWLGMFVHPYLMNPDYVGEDSVSTEEFASFARKLRALGYRFETLSEVRINGVEPSQTEAQDDLTNDAASERVKALRAQELIANKLSGLFDKGETEASSSTNSSDRATAPATAATPASQPAPKNLISTLKLQSTGFCLDSFESRAFQFECSQGSGQDFEFLPTETANQFSLKSRASAECLNVNNTSTEADRSVSTEACANLPQQQFLFQAVGDSFQLIASQSGLCLSSKADFGGADLIEKTCNPEDATQLWAITQP